MQQHLKFRMPSDTTRIAKSTATATATSTVAGLFSDDTLTIRCAWCQATPNYRRYHDTESGFPVSDKRRLFEKKNCLEGLQAELS